MLNLYCSARVYVLLSSVLFVNQPTGARAISTFGGGTGQIFLDNVGCSGTELYLANCTNNGIGVHNCVHSEDAGITCMNSTTQCNNGDLRLIGGSNSFEGRVEICWNNEWATICDDFWDAGDASVVCNQLRYDTSGMHAVLQLYYYHALNN